MTRLWQAWVELLDRREAPTSLVLTRVLVASVVLFDLLYVRSLGLVDAVWAPPPDGVGYGALWSKPPPFMVRWFGAGADTTHMVWTIAVLSTTSVLLGAGTRVACVVAVLALAQLGHMAPDSDRGIDFFLRAVLMVLAFSGCNARWSLDAWVRRRVGRPMPEAVPAWPRYVLFLQLVWIYFSAGHNKADMAWGPTEGFTALANILTDPHFARFDPAWIPAVFPLLRAATLATMVFELSSILMPLFTHYDQTRGAPGRLRRLCNRLYLRWLWIASGLMFHLGIAVTMRLGIFPFGVLAIYPVLFHPTELARAGSWLVARWRGRKRTRKSVGTMVNENSSPT